MADSTATTSTLAANNANNANKTGSNQSKGTNNLAKPSATASNNNAARSANNRQTSSTSAAGNNNTNKSSNNNKEEGILDSIMDSLGISGDNNTNAIKSATNNNTNKSTSANNTYKTNTLSSNNTTPKSTASNNNATGATQSILKSASNSITDIKESITDRIEELQEDKTSLMSSLLKIVIVVLVLVALFYVSKYLFTRYQNTLYYSPYLLDAAKNGKHALVISQDPANPTYIAMPKSDGQDGLQFTYDFWLLIDGYDYKKGEWKHLFHKGNASSYPNRAPGIWLHPDNNSMRIYMNTQDNILEYIDVDNLPLRKWIHIVVVLNDLDMDIFINGYLKKRQRLTSVAKLNTGDFWVNMFGGFDGYLAKIRYYSKAITVDEIVENMRNGPGNTACIDTGQVPPYLDDDWWIN